jgi:hypothetical protein
MRILNARNFRKIFLLCSLFVVLGWTGGIPDVAKAQPGNAPPGCKLDAGDPGPPNETPPCKTGVHQKPPGDGTPHWSCLSSGTSPNQTCHWLYEDRLGCNNGGAGTMCDTVATGGGQTSCVCVAAP